MSAQLSTHDWPLVSLRRPAELITMHGCTPSAVRTGGSPSIRTCFRWTSMLEMPESNSWPGGASDSRPRRSASPTFSRRIRQRLSKDGPFEGSGSGWMGASESSRTMPSRVSCCGCRRGSVLRLPSAYGLPRGHRRREIRLLAWLVWYHPCSKVSKVGHDSAQRGFTKLTNNSQRSPRSLFPQTKHHSGPPALSPSASALHHASFESATAVAVLTLNEMAEAS